VNQVWRNTQKDIGEQKRKLATTVGGGLRSGAAFVVVRLDVVSFRPALQRRRWRVVSWVDILLDVIVGVESALRRRPPRRRASPAPFFLADGGGLSVGWILMKPNESKSAQDTLCR
jgi:hypothetical protein